MSSNYKAPAGSDNRERRARYGRVMSRDEYHGMLQSGVLRSSYENGSVPVFDCPPCVERRLGTMTAKTVRDVFKQVGATSKDYMVVFEAAPDGTSIPFRRGSLGWLTEHKLGQGTPVTIVYSRKL